MIRKITEFILYSHIFIGFGAFALNYVCQVYMLDGWRDPVLSLFCFGACWFSYLFHRFNVYETRDAAKDNEVMLWTKNNMLVLRSIVLILGLALLYQFFQFNFQTKILLGLVGFISFSYSSDFFGYPLRNIPFLKIFLISFNWAACCALLLVTQHADIHPELIAWGFIHVSLLIFILTIPFDIRDMNYDQKDQLPTIPSKLGINKSKILAIILCLVWVGITFLQCSRLKSIEPIIQTFLFALLMIGLIYKSNKDNGEMYFLGLIDGCIILWGLIVFVFKPY